MIRPNGNIGQPIKHRTTENECSGAMTSNAIYELVLAQGKRCALTGWKLHPQDASVDHIVPLSQGGTHTSDNAQILHSKVNTAKGTMSNDEFIELCCAVADYQRTGPSGM